jgi:hypothetical protein
VDNDGNVCGPVSRYAARIVCERLPPYQCYIYAGGFDESGQMMSDRPGLSLGAARRGNHQVPLSQDETEAKSLNEHKEDERKPNVPHSDQPADVLTTYGVRLYSPSRKKWFEVSLRGGLYEVRQTHQVKRHCDYSNSIHCDYIILFATCILKFNWNVTFYHSYLVPARRMDQVDRY